MKTRRTGRGTRRRPAVCLVDARFKLILICYDAHVVFELRVCIMMFCCEQIRSLCALKQIAYLILDSDALRTDRSVTDRLCDDPSFLHSFGLTVRRSILLGSAQRLL